MTKWEKIKLKWNDATYKWNRLGFMGKVSVVSTLIGVVSPLLILATNFLNLPENYNKFKNPNHPTTNFFAIVNPQPAPLITNIVNVTIPPITVNVSNVVKNPSLVASNDLARLVPSGASKPDVDQTLAKVDAILQLSGTESELFTALTLARQLEMNYPENEKVAAKLKVVQAEVDYYTSFNEGIALVLANERRQQSIAMAEGRLNIPVTNRYSQYTLAQRARGEERRAEQKAETELVSQRFEANLKQLREANHLPATLGALKHILISWEQRNEGSVVLKEIEGTLNQLTEKK